MNVNVAQGRTLHIPQADQYSMSILFFMLRGVCVFNFHDLCGEALGAADYMALCSNFHTLVLNNIPQMKMDDVAECRRFITLVDELYENKVCSCSRMTHSFIGQAHLPS